ncbi:hypothetical protein FH972_019218 [Carpinus fangiana]|uniref:Uncharacterized protein n=1 Tax=Carpinus fangiana TaxID=176857 RepID=A0A5N6RSR2_9ROSI|nr:hypothetical protein FH972_019218 [Carpinus fangiana]
MRRSSDYTSRQQHGWDNSSYDYHAHIHRMERTPTMLPGPPQYPNLAFSNKIAHEEDRHAGSNHKHHHKNQTPVRFQEKVEVISYEQAEEEEAGKNGACEVYEESIDVEADGFIKQKRKGLELCKWKTFKAH